MAATHAFPASTALPQRSTLALHDRLGERIDCLGGRLWITQDGDQRDVVLEPGESFELDRPGLALVSALSDARLAVRRPGTPRLAALAAADVQRLRALFELPRDARRTAA